MMRALRCLHAGRLSFGITPLRIMWRYGLPLAVVWLSLFVRPVFAADEKIFCSEEWQKKGLMAAFMDPDQTTLITTIRLSREQRDRRVVSIPPVPSACLAAPGQLAAKDEAIPALKKTARKYRPRSCPIGCRCAGTTRGKGRGNPGTGKSAPEY